MNEQPLLYLPDGRPYRPSRAPARRRTGRWAAFLTAALSLSLAVPAELGSETMTLTTYYPSPAGVYKTLTSTQQTVLARDGGRVGIGTATPAAKLDVAGDIAAAGGLRPGTQEAVTACSAAKAGTMRYNTALKRIEYCNGAGWQASGLDLATQTYLASDACDPGDMMLGLAGIQCNNQTDSFHITYYDGSGSPFGSGATRRQSVQVECVAGDAVNAGTAQLKCLRAH